MKQFIHQNKKIISVAAACLLIGVATMSFQNTPFGPLGKLDNLIEMQDTIPGKDNEAGSKMSIKDFDQLVKHLNLEDIKMQNELSEIDFDKMKRAINASLNNVDFDKIQMNIDKAMKEIDFSKLAKSVQSALKGAERNNMNNDLRVSLQDAKKEMEKINMVELKKEMEKAKMEIEKSKNEIKKISVEAILKNATDGVAWAKGDLRLTKEMFNEMEKEGLISQKDGFTIEFKDRALYIDGKQQSDAITDKYRRYIKGSSFKISINKE